MSPIPSQCEAKDQEVSALKQQFNALAEQANGLVGEPVWPVLGQLGDVRHRLAQAQQDLARCIESYTSGSTGTMDGTAGPQVTAVVRTLDGGIATPRGNQEATLWELTAVGATEREKAAVNGDKLELQNQLPASAAITVATTGMPELTGPDFRSGPLEGPATGPLRLEIVLGPSIALSVKELETALAALLPITSAVGGSMVEGSSTVTALDVALEPGVATVAASGTFSGTAGGFPIGGVAFAGRAALSLAPATGPDAEEVIAVASARPIEMQFSGSLLASVATMLSPFIEPFVENLAMTHLRARIREWMRPALAEALVLAGLPKDCTVSLRSVSVDKDGIVFQPAIGCVGDALSTYDPPPIPTV